MSHSHKQPFYWRVHSSLSKIKNDFIMIFILSSFCHDSTLWLHVILCHIFFHLIYKITAKSKELESSSQLPWGNGNCQNFVYTFVQIFLIIKKVFLGKFVRICAGSGRWTLCIIGVMQIQSENVLDAKLTCAKYVKTINNKRLYLII